MSRPPDTKDRILTLAQEMIQRDGYNGFSFRDIAEHIGIKSASIHYHFPNKADLAAAVARRYTDSFVGALEEGGAPPRAIRRYADSFRTSLVDQNRMCLCGMLGAEVGTLPPIVRHETRRFFDRNVDWLEHTLLEGQRSGTLVFEDRPRTEATQLLATLEGAMIVARSSEDFSLFDRITRSALGKLGVRWTPARPRKVA